MVDVHNKEIRSYNMSRIQNKNTKPELLIRKTLFKQGFRYRINVKKLIGTPDIVLMKYKTIVFINGCFWHGHKKCKKFVIPKTRTEWWLNKINANIKRDSNNCRILRKDGWKIITIWECQLSKLKIDRTLAKLIKKIIC
jgi:DNA mismatch endonuclease, patch repair protein